MRRVPVIGVLLLALTGCGTAKNFTDGHKGQTKPYGGVKIAAAEFNWGEPIVLALLWPFWTADVVLSAVGDTAMLPVTVPIAIVHAVNKGINDSYFPKDKPALHTPAEEPPAP